MLQYLLQKLKPGMPEDAESDLKKLTQLLLGSQHPIEEIRVFGSLNNGSWDRERSDIDVFVLMEENESYSCFTRRVIGHMFYDGDTVPIYGETEEREQMRESVKNSHELDFSSRYSLQIATPGDLERMAKNGSPPKGMWSLGNQNEAPFVRAMKEGRLLYSRKVLYRLRD